MALKTPTTRMQRWGIVLPTMCLCALSHCLIGSQAFAQQETASQTPPTIHSSSTQFLILKTGSVYSGQLEFGGGKYIIHRNNGSSVRFHQGEVDFVTHSLDEAYQQLVSRLDNQDVIGHQRLAKWCLKNRQIENARRELAVLAQLPGGKKSLKLLERQIEELANPRSEQTPAQVASHSQSSDSGVRRLPRTGARMASREELMNTIDSFSRESLREFNRGVHLRIVNGCAAARCHGDPENQLRLWRVDNRGGITSTGVQRNLHAITHYIDRQNPAESVLLRYVSEVHADMDAPAYDPTSHHFHAIRDWVFSTAQQTESTEFADQDPVSQTSFLDRPGSATGVATGVATVAATGELMQGELMQGELMQGELMQGELMQGELIPTPVDLTRKEKRFMPRDEFDAEIFNRKYGDPNSRPTANVNNLPAANDNAPPAKNTRSLPPVEDNQSSFQTTPRG